MQAVAGVDDTPLVSVLIPAYQAEAYVADAIASVLQQDYPALEILVVDDASTDGTPAVVERITDPRVTLLRRGVNGGAAAARDTGLAVAQGPLIALLDADDFWLPNKLRRQVDYMSRHKDVVLTYAGIRFEVDGLASSVYQPPLELTFHDLMAHRLVPVQTMVYRKSAVERIGGFRSPERVAEDLDVCLRLTAAGVVAGVPDVLAVARIHATNTSRDQQAVADATLAVLDRYAHHHCRSCRRAIRTTRYEFGRPVLLDAARQLRRGRRPADAVQAVRVIRRYPDVLLTGVLRRTR